MGDYADLMLAVVKAMGVFWAVFIVGMSPILLVLGIHGLLKKIRGH